MNYAKRIFQSIPYQFVGLVTGVTCGFSTTLRIFDKYSGNISDENYNAMHEAGTYAAAWTAGTAVGTVTFITWPILTSKFVIEETYKKYGDKYYKD